jgi:hypothetical protein
VIPTTPVLQVLAWRLVAPELVARESYPGESGETEDGAPSDAWVRRRLCEGALALPFQLATDAILQARQLAASPLDGLRIIAEATLRLEHAVPRVHDEDAWDSVCRIVPADIVALALPDIADRDPREAGLQQRLGWPPILRAHQTVFHKVCNAELAEVHAHLGGSMPTGLLWALLWSGALRPEALVQANLEFGADPDWRDALLEAQSLLASFNGPDLPGLVALTIPLPDGELARRLLRGVRLDQELDDSTWPFEGQTVGRTAVGGLLVPERLAIHRALWCRSQGYLDEASEAHRDALSRIRRYVAIRSAFNVLLSQPPSQRGLNEFRSWYDRRSALWIRPGRGAPARANNARRAEALGIELLLESWLLDHNTSGPGPCKPLDIELRTCLPLNGRAATDFFVTLARGVRSLLERWKHPPLRVGIIHHTIKRAGREQGHEALDEFERVWDLLVAFPEIRPLLVGLDAASDELACPPRSFAKAYAWIRSKLDRDAMPDDGPPIRLGFTFHAGEDFRDLLTGIRHVDEAAHLLGMRAGDRLGHALALSWPVEEFYIERHAAFPTVADRALDLAWAGAVLFHAEGHGEFQRDARERLMALLTDCGARPLVSVSDLLGALDVDGANKPASPRARTLWSKLFKREEDASAHADSVEPPERALLESELLYLMGISEVAASAFAPPPQRPREWRRLVGACQALARQRLLKQGLVVEINPSSNRIVGGFATIDRLPYTNLNRPGPRLPDQPANIPLCMGTDDAGILHTSLRREYELVGKSAIARGFDLPDVHAWLDEIRVTGRRACFIRDHAPAGKDLFDSLAGLLEERDSDP